ncbi:hypothetical protein OPV22_006097 [Ensete ventricosum]|uniref:HMA domain-containing protein n=1 Tax=Ensete ventricosum TaxID=4639 RepID=A0AAV8Q4P8_ENSVE|nr:hypothetical protein OPV22_006097 [Ensete ventricosum]
MGTPPHLRSLLLAVLLMIGSTSAATQTETLVTVVGATECLDCAQKSIKTEDAVKGLRVAIRCKATDHRRRSTSHHQGNTTNRPRTTSRRREDTITHPLHRSTSRRRCHTTSVQRFPIPKHHEQQKA